MKESTSAGMSMKGERRYGRSCRGRLGGALLAGVAAALLAGALPAAASAADYCVAPNTTCGGSNVATFEQALDLADNATDADRIFLGAATYTAANPDGYYYGKPDSPVEIVGAGNGHTILTTPAPGGDGVISLTGGAGTSIHDLTIELPQNTVGGLVGLYTTNTARRIQVIEDPTQANVRRGVVLASGGTLEDSSVTLGAGHGSTAVVLDVPGGGTVRRSVLSAQTGVESLGGGTIQRSSVSGSEHAVLDYGSVTAIADSLLQATGSPFGVGIDAVPQPGSDASVTADGVTIVGSGAANTYGVRADLEGATVESAHVTLTNSVIRGTAYPLVAWPDGTGHATIDASYSDYDPSGNSASGANASISAANVSNVGDAGFVDAAGGDYHLRPGSPLVDMGDPATAQGLDLDGNPLVADGNGDGTARRDMGAFELQPAPVAGQQPTGDQQPETAVPDTQPPLVSGFRADPTMFAAARAGTPIAAGIPRGTHFRYTLSEPARVTLKIQRALAGRRQHGKCVRPTPQLRHTKCVRYRTIGALSRSAEQGANSTRFTGRIGTRALRPGSYRAVISATDAAANRSAPRATRFRIARS